jgi:recombination protein RecA
MGVTPHVFYLTKIMYFCMAVEKQEEEKVLSLEDFNRVVRKQCGKDAVISAETKESYGDVIPCTSFSLSNALGIGGFAKRKIYTIDGDLSAGKSTTAYDVIGKAQQTYGDQCLLIDKEDSYTREYGAMLGVDNDKLTIVTPHTQEDMYETLVTAIKSKLFGVIVVDSVTSFAPEARFEGRVVMGIEARVNSDKMRLVADAMSKSNTCLILIQQTREKIGGMGDPTTVSGGKAIPFYAHCRIRITRSEIKREEQQNVMKFTIIKNKMAAPFKVGTVIYKWDQGFDFFSEVGELAIEFGIIKKEGNSHYLPEVEAKFVGKKKVMAYLTDNPEYTKAVIEPLVLDVLKNDTTLRITETAENELS